MKTIRRWGAFVVLAALLLTACTGGNPRPSPTETPTESGQAVPNVVGATTGVADVRLRAAGLLLEVNVEGMPQASQPDGLVQSQSPAAGTVVAVGSVVTVSAVCTPQALSVPNRRGAHLRSVHVRDWLRAQRTPSGEL